MTDRDGQTITWDVENRPTTIDSETYVYDGDGNRIMKTVSGVTTLYINMYYEKNTSTNTVTVSYYLGDRLIAQKEGETIKYIHQDSLSSSSVMSDSVGQAISTITYFPFGATRTGSVDTEKQFTGQRQDDTGLYYYGARYYDPTIGRFISADTVVQYEKTFDTATIALCVNLSISNLGSYQFSTLVYPGTTNESPINPQCFNRYTYVLNNPLKYIDPNGFNTVAIGLYSSAGCGVDLDACIMLVFDDKGNWGIMTVVAPGGMIGASMSAGVTYQWTNADTIFDLAGESTQVGGSITLGEGVAIGAEYVYGEGYEGFNINIGAGIGTPEVHAVTGYTYIESYGNDWWAILMYNILTLGIQEDINALLDLLSSGFFDEYLQDMLPAE
ncbi:MAG: RHS repeat-associated core domain-containing protein [Eubacteriales bacterium]